MENRMQGRMEEAKAVISNLLPFYTLSAAF